MNQKRKGKERKKYEGMRDKTKKGGNKDLRKRE
jgi:hypothetical protein